MRSVRLHILSSLSLLGAACASPSVTGEIHNEPVCPDFELGAGQVLKGSLKRPVNVRILEDDEPRWGRVLLGKRAPGDPNSKFVVEDDDEEYLVEWAQCVNEFAPKRVDFNDPNAQRGSGYQCGDAEKYAETKLVIVEGDLGSRVIQWQAPPTATCWTSMDISSGTPSPNASASAAVENSAAVETVDDPPPPPDAGAGDGSDAGATTSASARAPLPQHSAVDSKVPPDGKTASPPREDRRQLGKEKDQPPPPTP